MWWSVGVQDLGSQVGSRAHSPKLQNWWIFGQLWVLLCIFMYPYVPSGYLFNIAMENDDP